ncbi:unnamed protein product [Anisakis simplex]|uniref:Uncharacterized protein n=1 Tax=Anisakis simplex TaxID=6269 RepID=A0A0M3JRN0_ANISI|nr:unnamed protein product [Anisakis simplex]
MCLQRSALANPAGMPNGAGGGGLCKAPGGTLPNAAMLGCSSVTKPPNSHHQHHPSMLFGATPFALPQSVHFHSFAVILPIRNIFHIGRCYFIPCILLNECKRKQILNVDVNQLLKIFIWSSHFVVNRLRECS